ncbi:hypothetical protein HMPREF6485_1385 [Segatella buccae ATCC 33574]|uniref:Uncharacterized protein n=1 Tax=Segatella buccae ATCC 33574 TaxID=873513 RepID=E6K6Y5_9BACT|nr:hypothetical protein HMPREF6485_1385 [Segatella buccae ATCC 33574]
MFIFSFCDLLSIACFCVQKYALLSIPQSGKEQQGRIGKQKEMRLSFLLFFRSLSSFFLRLF